MMMGYEIQINSQLGWRYMEGASRYYRPFRWKNIHKNSPVDSGKSPAGNCKQSGSATVEFMFAFILILWVIMGFIDVVFQGYNAMIVNYGSYTGARGYIVDDPGGRHWAEGAEKIGLGTLMHTDIKAYMEGTKVYLRVTNKEMTRAGIIWGKGRKGTMVIGNDLGEQEDDFSGDNAP